MVDCRLLTGPRSKQVPAALILAFLVPASVGAQVPGYPIDPYSQSSSSSTQQAPGARRSGNNQDARGAADAQMSVPGSTSSDSYEPDEIGSSTGTRQGRDRADVRDLSPGARDRQGNDDLSTRRARPVARPSEFENYVSQIIDKPLRRFGANLLVAGAREFTAPPTTTVPPDYRLNPGDELLLRLTGSVEASDLRLVIDSEGRVFIPRVGAVNVAGVRYGDVQALIARQVSRQYRSFRVAVSIGRLHGITVYMTGFAVAPGSYTISSLSTLVNAVLTAGGPSGGGSFRSIQVRRNGQLISDFDLYDLLLKGDKSADVVLQNDDVIFIAPAGAQVAVIGSVNVEAIYEVRGGETIYSLLLYAGGINTVADDTRLLLLDPTKSAGWQELTPQQVEARTASRSQIVRVLPAVGIAQPLFKQPALVMISGEVTKPGHYYVQPGTPLSSVIAQAGGFTSQAFPYAAVFTRESVQQIQRKSYERALRDLELLLTAAPLTSVSQNEQLHPARLAAVQSVIEQLKVRTPDGRLVLNILPSDRSLPTGLVVENNDTLYIPPQPITVGVFGAVPSSASFEYRQNETVGEYLQRAGGVQKLGDRSGIFVVRANGTLLANQRGLFRGSILNQAVLPGDLIFVPVNATRGEFWARLRDISSVLFPAALTAAAVTK